MRVISGTARGTKLYSLEGNVTRPTLDRVNKRSNSFGFIFWKWSNWYRSSK